MNINSVIQICGLEKGQCGMRAEASSAHNHHEAPALPSLSSLPPKQQLEQELPYHCHERVPNVADVSLNIVSDIFLDEGETKACASVSVDAGDSSLGRSGSQLTHRVSPECEHSLLPPSKTVHCTADNSLDVCELSFVYGGHVFWQSLQYAYWEWMNYWIVTDDFIASTATGSEIYSFLYRAE